MALDFKENGFAADQPVASVRWIHRDDLRANHYNPNHVAPIELDLLAVSILEDGWTQPIVIHESGEIVDGYHRWLVSGRRDVAVLTDGFVPVSILTRSDADQILSTIRHNRARGMHGILPMAQIVRTLKDEHGLNTEAIEKRLGMEDEEIDRLYDASSMPEKAADKRTEFSPGWKPG